MLASSNCSTLFCNENERLTIILVYVISGESNIFVKVAWRYTWFTEFLRFLKEIPKAFYQKGGFHSDKSWLGSDHTPKDKRLFQKSIEMVPRSGKSTDIWEKYSGEWATAFS